MGNWISYAGSLLFGFIRGIRGIKESPYTTNMDNANDGFLSNDDKHITAVEAITERLGDVTSLAEKLDNALCVVQAETLLNTSVSPSSKACLDASVPGQEEWLENGNKVRMKTPHTSSDSKSEDEFVTASECTCTPPSRSSSFQTASEGGTTSPWWDVDPTSDSDDKTKACVSSKHLRRSPARITSEASAERLVREITETTKLKITTSPNLGMSSYLLEKSTDLLRPDMTSPLPITSSDKTAGPGQSNTEEIVRKLTEIVQNNESYRTNLTENELSPVTSDNSTEPNHSKSQSYETDNTDGSLPKFSGQIPINTQAEIPKFSGQIPINTQAEIPKFDRNRRSRSNEDRYIIDTTTPSPRSKPYMETSFDNLEMYDGDVPGTSNGDEIEDLTERLSEVRNEPRTTTTIDLQGSCPLTPSEYYYQAQITRLAIKGIF